MPKLLRHLRWMEFLLVVAVALFLLGLALFLGVWVIWGCGNEIHSRLIQTIKGMNTGWRVSLLLLVPLFFRPIYKFLWGLHEGPLGMKSGLQARPSEKPVEGYSEGEGLKPHQMVTPWFVYPNNGKCRLYLEASESVDVIVCRPDQVKVLISTAAAGIAGALYYSGKTYLDEIITLPEAWRSTGWHLIIGNAGGGSKDVSAVFYFVFPAT